MSRAEFAHALGCGQRATAASVDAGADLLILGEMGIGNTTAAAAIAAALTGLPPEQIVGDGTGVDAAGRARKAAVQFTRLWRSIVSRRRPSTPPNAWRRSEGSKIVALAGAMIRCGAGGRARARRRFHRLRRSACGGQDQPERRAVADLLAPLGRARSRAGARRSFGAASA